MAKGGHLAKTVACAVNVALCRKEEFKIRKAEHPWKVIVIDDSPAGMKAARVCVLRDHDVPLYETRELGGMLLEGCIPDFKADTKLLIRT